jgi:hypothetical protein
MDPRILTGPALVIIGAFLVTISLRLIFVHPINRVFRIGPFVTEEGLRAVLRSRALLFSYGMFFLTQGVASAIFWLGSSQDLHNLYVVAFGSFGAVFAVAAACFTLAAAVRMWGRK